MDPCLRVREREMVELESVSILRRLVLVRVDALKCGYLDLVNATQGIGSMRLASYFL